jgi:hypothetical protein
MKGNALIRGNLGVDPEGLNGEQWAQRFAEALWLEQWRLKNQAELLAAMFGGTKS